MRLPRLAALLVVAVLASTSSVESRGSVDAGRSAPPSKRLNGVTLPDDKVSLTYPFNWYATTRHLDNVLDPRTLVAVASYVIPGGPAEDCFGSRARGRPVDGVFVLVKEVLDGASLKRSLPRLPERPRRFQIPSSGRSGCLPPNSAVYQFRVGQRAFYVFVSVGPRTTAATRQALRRVLDTMTIASHR
ncbi:MAG: hypothetical protein QOH95_1434 [Gaiellaceae bacterium]|jgi:hypothetical protein|nr:hypothetical protein [Gaiellaceae bacterium]